MIGTTDIPTQAMLKAKRPTFFIGKVKKASEHASTDEKQIPIRTSLYLAYLSSITPKMNEPITPAKMKIAPNKLLFPELYPYGVVKELTTAPSDV